MESAPNPFSPGINEQPAVIAGRDQQLGDINDAVNRLNHGGGGTILAYQGHRGYGKTVLLGALRERAAEHGWLTCSVEARPDTPLADHLVQRLLASLDRAQITTTDTNPARRRLQSMRVGTRGIGFELTPPQSATPNLDQLLSNVCTQLAHHQVGLALTIDELQVAGVDDIRSFVSLLQENRDERWPLAVGLAYLPTLTNQLAGRNDDSTGTLGFLERSQRAPIGMLDDHAVRDCLIRTANHPDNPTPKTWQPGALQLATDTIQGYPFYLQLLGAECWRLAGQETTITDQHARDGVALAEPAFETAVFANRWAACTPAQRDYLTAAAHAYNRSDHTVATRDIAQQLDKTPQQLSYLRDRLLRAGVIVDAGWGRIAFPFPQFPDYIRRHSDHDG